MPSVVCSEMDVKAMKSANYANHGSVLVPVLGREPA